MHKSTLAALLFVAPSLALADSRPWSERPAGAPCRPASVSGLPSPVVQRPADIAASCSGW